MKHLLKLSDLTREELFHILDVADQLKADHKAGKDEPLLAGKAVALVFTKRSTRTRTSFEVGTYQMGGLGTNLNNFEMQSYRGEPIQDTARTLGRYYDGIVLRTYKQWDVESMARWSGVPVINGMTDYCHPCQILAFLQTVRERKGGFEGLKVCYVGDGNNVANSLIVGSLMAGMTVTAVCPKNYEPAADVLEFAQSYPGKFTLTTDPKAGAVDADIVYTDVWTSQGQEDEAEQRRKAFRGYQINRQLLALAKPDCMVQHPLPANRSQEITNEVLEAHADSIFDEVENRLHVQKAVMAILLAGK